MLSLRRNRFDVTRRECRFGGSPDVTYGNVIDQYGNMSDQFTFGFSTKYLDRETGLISFLYRFYNPVTGCWLNRDPAEEKGGENLYCYCCNNALSSFDVQGEVSLSDLKNIMSRLANIRKHLDEVLSSMTECFKVVRSWYPKNARDSETDDKYRHCVASCEIANACGDKISIALGLTKEMRDLALAAVWKADGEIEERAGLNLAAPITLKSTPEQDIKMLEMIREEMKSPPFYNGAFHNCLFWSVGAINYGM